MQGKPVAMLQKQSYSPSSLLVSNAWTRIWNIIVVVVVFFCFTFVHWFFQLYKKKVSWERWKKGMVHHFDELVTFAEVCIDNALTLGNRAIWADKTTIFP